METSAHLAPGASLLVFTLGERRECQRRRLLPTRWQTLEQRLHRACLEAALEAGRRAGCRLRVSSPIDCDLPSDVLHRPQDGQNFGARLRRALDETFRASEGPVVLVGSDVPGISEAPIRQALADLAEDPDRVVLGPSPDGGFYLLATRRPLDEALAAVRWCCGDTLESLIQALEQQGRTVTLLPALDDLDHRADLERWLAEAISEPPNEDWKALRALLRIALSRASRPAVARRSSLPGSFFRAQPLTRGPPSLASSL